LQPLPLLPYLHSLPHCLPLLLPRLALQNHPLAAYWQRHCRLLLVVRTPWLPLLPNLPQLLLPQALPLPVLEPLVPPAAAVVLLLLLPQSVLLLLPQ
jgi:hypothetical protein